MAIPTCALFASCGEPSRSPHCAHTGPTAMSVAPSEVTGVAVASNGDDGMAATATYETVPRPSGAATAVPVQTEAEEEKKGRATLLEWGRLLTVRTQRGFTLALSPPLVMFGVAGIQMLRVFDADHAYFAYGHLAAGATFAVMSVVAFANPVPPEAFGRLALLPGAGTAVTKMLSESTCQTVFTALHNVVVVALTALFMLSDLSGRGGSGASNSLRWSVVVSMMVALGPTIVLSVGQLACARCAPVSCTLPAPQPMTSETALSALLGATTRLVTDVSAGMPVAKLEWRLLQVREIMAMLWSSAAISVVFFLLMCAMILANFVVCVVEPAPPALFVYTTVSLVVPLFLMPLTAVRVDVQLRRVSVALSVRACQASGRRAEARAEEEEEEGYVDVEAQREAGAAGAKQGFETAVVRALQQQRLDMQQQQLDLLVTRIDKMKLGWHVLGAPVTSTLLARARAVAGAIMLLIWRQNVGF